MSKATDLGIRSSRWRVVYTTPGTRGAKVSGDLLRDDAERLARLTRKLGGTARIVRSRRTAL